MDFRGFAFSDSSVKSLDKERIDAALLSGQVEPDTGRLLHELLGDGSQGLYAEIEGKIAGYAWIQRKGEYRWGPSGRLSIPDNYVIFKNLFVCPAYRGQKTGQKLNAARLAQTEAGKVPTVFIIPENRYAIRNWEKYGFQRVAEVKQWRWAGGVWHMKVRRLTNLPEAEQIIGAIENAGQAE